MDGRTDGAVQEQQEQQQQSRLKRREKKEKGIVLGKVERSSDQNLLRSGPVRLRHLVSPLVGKEVFFCH